MIVAGLDLGSVNTKMVILDGDRVVFKKAVPSRFDPVSTGRELLSLASQEYELAETVVTGYGRVSFPESRVVTEITCQAKGCHYFYPDISYILDLGGQDAKVIKKNAQGKVLSFVMNDKCAAGTGRFLDVILKGLDLTPSDIDLALEAEPVTLNSMCTVFAESEVITLLAKGTPKLSVLAGLFKSTATRLARFIETQGQPEMLIFTGGGAYYRPLIRLLEKELSAEVVVPPEPELTAALGAARAAKSG
ncbi:acyl-CoA dehydratase activase [Paradesulfitobacterium ferrireducens]|uniref:acyl-CoA dehydratase activase n=1 Tax=Paradesulfitobacterium ferrireducens TaxID=2816476 RepID=UPI001A90B65E|nr:acyl-CoA dehydratase activase [Paradesulfitobacterium ferrireducens]